MASMLALRLPQPQQAPAAAARRAELKSHGEHRQLAIPGSAPSSDRRVDARALATLALASIPVHWGLRNRRRCLQQAATSSQRGFGGVSETTLPGVATAIPDKVLVATKPPRSATQLVADFGLEDADEGGAGNRSKLRDKATTPLSEASELLKWLKGLGCTGIDAVEIRSSQKRGVWFRNPSQSSTSAAMSSELSSPSSSSSSSSSSKPRATATTTATTTASSSSSPAASPSDESSTVGDHGCEVLVVPREAWISVPMSEDAEDDAEVELTWKLLQERWKGSKSFYAPYVDFLWKQKLSHHPMLWDEHEVEWLRGCDSAHKAVLELRQTSSRRLVRLLERAQAQGGLQEASFSEEELRFALCLVEGRCSLAEGAAEGDAPLAALVPLIDHICHDASGSPRLQIVEREGVFGGPMVAEAFGELSAGSELRYCYGLDCTSVHLFAHYGLVPGQSGKDEASISDNAHNEVLLPIRIQKDNWRETPEDVKAAKLKLLAERGGLDLRDEEAEPCLQLPHDFDPQGRLLPTARFITTPVKVMEGDSMEEACQELFAKLFARCDLSLLPGNEHLEWGAGPPPTMPPVPESPAEMGQEVQARVAAWEWCERILIRYNKMSKRIAKAFSSPSVADPRIGQVLMAHFKAKGPGGENAKSRTTKQARVLDVSGSPAMVTVQFLHNKVRHTIPEDWLLGADGTPVAGALEALPTDKDRARRKVSASRAQLLQRLLQAEAPVIEAVYDVTSNVVKLGVGVLDARMQKDGGKAADYLYQWGKYWRDEHKEFQ